MNPYYFWSLWGFDALIAAVVVYFFIVGVGDGSITSRNILLWFGLLGFVGLILWGGWWFYAHHRYLPANTVLWILALPGLFFLLYLLIVIIGKPRWN